MFSGILSAEGLPEDWRALFLSEAQKPYWRELIRFLEAEHKAGLEIFPAAPDTLRAFHETSLEQTRVVILGQDPYHGPGQAMGRSFAVPNSLTPKPPSLLNIFKELEADQAETAKTVTINRSHSDLTGWTSQGVLLLNSVLTVRQGAPLSHCGRGWEILTDRLLEALATRTEPLVFILWGAEARKKKPLVSRSHHLVLESAHPSPLSAYRGFFGSRPFSKANAFLRAPIDWTRISTSC